MKTLVDPTIDKIVEFLRKEDNIPITKYKFVMFLTEEEYWQEIHRARKLMLAHDP